MLINKSENTITDFLELFKKKFSNFCVKSPCLLSFDCNMEKVIVKEDHLKETFDFRFDHSKTVKENINDIRNYLMEHWYPVMIQEKKEYLDYTPEEMEVLIDESNSTLEQISFAKKEIVTIFHWRIERIIIKKNELFVRNLETGKQYRYYLEKISAPVFLRKMFSDWTPTYTYRMFEQKSKFLNEIYPDYKKREDKNEEV